MLGSPMGLHGWLGCELVPSCPPNSRITDYLEKVRLKRTQDCDANVGLNERVCLRTTRTCLFALVLFKKFTT